ncbi:MAG: DUF4815 domain-containing protein [Betaproteobacteria bacterium]|nr:DUF4815 domain-containing protein [Betaproteobacteria bacterium]
MDLSTVGGYYNRFNQAQNYDSHLFRAGKVLQSAELNELQSTASNRLKGIADVLFKDGDVIRDAQAIINADTGDVTMQSGAIYLYGAVRGIEPAEFTIATVGLVTIGVYLIEEIITELNDPALRDPATGTRNYEEPGAVRLKVALQWGFAGDGQEGEFYPVYEVEDGMLRAKEPPPQLDSVTQALARYDRDSAGGTYIVDGFHVAMADDLETGEQVFTVSEGRARVNGYGVEMPTARRLVYPAEADARFVDSEPCVCTNPAGQRVNLARVPVGEITQVRITAEKSVTITHGSFTGALDALPDSSVLSITKVMQGGTTYAAGTDYKLTGGQVDWSPAGAEPAPGSTYSVTYQYIATVAPDDPDESGFSVYGAVAGSLIMTSYNALLPRYDRLCLNAQGGFVWLGGIAADYHPIPPAIPNDLLLLATVHQTWSLTGTLTRRIIRDTVRTVPMQDLYAVSAKLDHVLGLVAQQRLEASADMLEAGMKKGLFVDPFLDDSLRDAGIAQDALINDGILALRVDADAYALGDDLTVPASLNYANTVALEQTMRTTEMLINPYMAFDLPGAVVSLTPAIDQFVDTRYVYNNARGEENLPYLRPLEVKFTLDRFAPSESIAAIEFDGISVTPTGITNVDGVITGKFTIPDNVPVGTKAVRFTGIGGSWGDAQYIGSNTLVTLQSGYKMPEQYIKITNSQGTTYLTSAQFTASSYGKAYSLICNSGSGIDPLAQTFTLPSRQQITGIDLWFTEAGTSQVIVQIRETSLGFPTKTVLAEARIEAGAIITNGNHTTILFPFPVLLNADTEYALTVLTTDPAAALAVAELGKYDDRARKWVTSQPYQVGVLLSSSNASTWTAHQDRDMAFRLLRASFAPHTRNIDLGSVAVTDATDLMLLPLTEITDAAATATYTLTLPDARQIVVSGQQHVSLDAPVTGAIGIAAQLTGNALFSPVLYPGSQLVSGTIADESVYISRAIPAGQNARVRVIFDALIPSGAGVAVDVAGIGASAPWISAAFSAARPVNNGYVEHIYEVADISSDMVRVRLTLTGNTTARPAGANLRVIVT